MRSEGMPFDHQELRENCFPHRSVRNYSSTLVRRGGFFGRSSETACGLPQGQGLDPLQLRQRPRLRGRCHRQYEADGPVHEWPNDDEEGRVRVPTRNPGEIRVEATGVLGELPGHPAAHRQEDEPGHVQKSPANLFFHNPIPLLWGPR